MMRAIWLLMLVLSAAAWGDVEVRFPLKGFYRPGKYMPVEVRARGMNSLRIGAKDSMPTEIEMTSGGAECVSPLLAADEMSDAFWQIKDSQRSAGRAIEQKFRSLGPEERLVGFTTIDMAIAHELFKDKQIIPIKLDAANPIAGDAAAWETLDAVVVEAGARLKTETIKELLACGVTIAIRDVEPPDRQNKWRSVGGYWVLDWAIVGPKAGGLNDAAFLPVAGWEADWPAAFRKRIFLIAVAFCVLVMGISIMARRPAAIGIVVLSLAFVVGLAAWWRGRAAEVEKAATVMVGDQNGIQRDDWRFISSPGACAVRIPWQSATHPFFQTRNPRISLVCGSYGYPEAFQCELDAGVKFGFLNRSLELGTMPAWEKLGDSAMMPLLREMYLPDGACVFGQIEATNGEHSNAETWPTILMKR